MADLSAILTRLEQIASRLERVEARVGGGGGGGGGASASADSGSVARFVEEFDNVVAEFVTPYAAAANEIGGPVGQQAAALVKGFAAQRAFLVVASSSKKPDDATFGSLLGPTGAALGEACAFKDAVARSDPMFQHLSAVAELAPALGWVQTNLPAPHVKSMGEAAEFYLNRILKDHKGEASHTAFVTALKGLYPALAAYTKTHHTTGVAWNPNGGAAPAAAPAASAPAAAAAPKAAAPKAAAPAGGAAPPSGALFSELNKEGGVTAGLKKVTRDMTNKDKKVNSVVTTTEKAVTSKTPKGPEKLELQGSKWVCENFTGRQDLVIEGAQRNHTLYVYKCDGCVIRIPSKINSVAIDSCTKTGCVFSDVVSQVEVVNCKSIQLQSLGKIPSIAIDKTSGAQVFLSNDCLDCQVVTAKSDEVNIAIPPATEAEDLTEFPIPEQFISTVNPTTRRVVTNIVEHKG